jgi:hypothetical protein
MRRERGLFREQLRPNARGAKSAIKSKIATEIPPLRVRPDRTDVGLSGIHSLGRSPPSRFSFGVAGIWRNVRSQATAVRDRSVQGEPQLSDLVAIAFPTEAKAEQVRQKLLAMQKEYIIELGDAVIAVKDAPTHHLSLSLAKETTTIKCFKSSVTRHSQCHRPA